MDIKGKNVLVVGATGGMGRVICKRLAEAGAGRLFLLSNEKDKLDKLSSELSVTNKIYECDLSNRASINDFLLRWRKDCSDLSLLVNAAGVGIYKNLAEMNDHDWDLSIAINLTAVQMMTRGVIDLLEAGDGGMVVSLGSGAGKIPMAGRSVYNATKFGLRGWSLSLSCEYEKGKVCFVLMSLGSVMTGFGPMTRREKWEQASRGEKRYLTPDQVAEKIVEIVAEEKPKAEVEFYPPGYVDEWCGL